MDLRSTRHSYERPYHAEHAKMARWLIAENDWGTVSTTSIHLAGAAFGNLVSYADGPKGNSTGRLLFYLTPMDATTTDLAANSAATLTVGEIQLAGSCGVMDPEDPTCAKVSISGRMQIVPGGDVAEAEQLLFRRHPQMKSWPRGHNFSIWELHVKEARLLDFYGGAATVSPEEYFTAELQRRTAVVA
ncbi:g7683 [Coccomyxa elongata]